MFSVLRVVYLQSDTHRRYTKRVDAWALCNFRNIPTRLDDDGRANVSILGIFDITLLHTTHTTRRLYDVYAMMVGRGRFAYAYAKLAAIIAASTTARYYSYFNKMSVKIKQKRPCCARCASLTCTPWSRLLMMRITRPALGLMEPPPTLDACAAA